MAEAEQVWTVG